MGSRGEVDSRRLIAGSYNYFVRVPLPRKLPPALLPRSLLTQQLSLQDFRLGLRAALCHGLVDVLPTFSYGVAHGG